MRAHHVVSENNWSFGQAHSTYPYSAHFAHVKSTLSSNPIISIVRPSTVFVVLKTRLFNKFFPILTAGSLDCLRSSFID